MIGSNETLIVSESNVAKVAEVVNGHTALDAVIPNGEANLESSELGEEESEEKFLKSEQNDEKCRDKVVELGEEGVKQKENLTEPENEVTQSDIVADSKLKAESEDKAAESKDKVAEFKDKVAESEDKAAESEDKVAESEDKAAESKDKAAESKDKVAEFKDKVAESEDKPAESEDKVAESKDKVAESEDKAAESEDKVAESEDKVAEAEDKAAESKDKVAESEDKAAESEDKVAESEDKVAEAEDKAAESEDKVAESEDKAAESEDKTAESEDKVAESEDKVAESEDKAAESEDKVTEYEDKAVESEDKAAESEDKAAEFEDKAAESKDKAAESEDKVAEAEDKIGESGEIAELLDKTALCSETAEHQGKAIKSNSQVSESPVEVTTDLVDTGNEINNKQHEKGDSPCLTSEPISDCPEVEESVHLNENLLTDSLPVHVTEPSPPEISESSDHGSSADLELSESESEIGDAVKRCPHAHQFVNDLIIFSSSDENSSDQDTLDISALRKERRQKRRRKRQQRLKKCCSGCDTQGTVAPMSPDLPDPIAISTGMLQCNVIKSFEEVVSTRYNSEEEIDAAISSYTAVGGRLANQNEQTFSDVDIAGYKSRSECGSPTSDPDLLVCDYSNSVGRKLANRNTNNQNDNLDECIGGFLLDSLNQNLDPTSRLFAMRVDELNRLAEGLRMKLQSVNEDLVNVVKENDDLKAEKSVITKHVTQLSRLVQGIRANDNSAFRKILVTRETDI
ncbi:hypothetical protein ACHWQZ_G001785 [Mnemiopsis leidyi]